MYINKGFIVLTILLLLSVLSLGWYSYNLTQELATLSNQQAALNKNIATLSDQKAALNKNIASLQTEVSLASSKLDTLTARLDSLAAETLSSVINVPKLYNQVKEGIVQVTTFRINGQKVSGSGFVFDNRGYLLTNHHVIEQAREIEITFHKGIIQRAIVVGSDAYSDVAVLKLSQYTGPVLTLGDSDKVNVGDNVIAIGNPFGLDGTVTSGIVSQKGRLLPGVGGFSIADVIQFDAAVNPGNSGGPLLNSKGEVIGITSARIESPRGAVGLGFAISSNLVKRVTPALMERGNYQHPYLGINVTNVTPKIAEAMNLATAQGVLITEVKTGSPAALAGLKAGDKFIEINGKKTAIGGDIIIAIDEAPVVNTNDLLNYLALHKSPGQITVLTIIRDGKEIKVVLTLGARPAP